MNETLDVLGAPMTIKRAEGLFLAEQSVPPGHFVPPHRHADDDETLLVLEGELTLIDDTGERTEGPGACVSFIPGVLHGFRNDSASAARILVIATPGLQLAEMFRHFDRAGRKTALAPPDIVAIASEYGVRFG